METTKHVKQSGYMVVPIYQLEAMLALAHTLHPEPRVENGRAINTMVLEFELIPQSEIVPGDSPNVCQAGEPTLNGYDLLSITHGNGGNALRTGKLEDIRRVEFVTPTHTNLPIV